MSRLTRALIVAAVTLAAPSLSTLGAQHEAHGAARPLAVQVAGTKGAPPMILIPGLTNGSDVWKSTVAAFGDRHEMHLLTLAGFAGQPAVATDSGWLELMRDEVVKYARRNRLEKPVLVGHSLGGFLALWIAATTPDLPSAVVNIDGLPFLGATGDPNATVASVRPQAAQMRQMMTAPGAAAQFAQMQDQQIRMMVRDTAGYAIVKEMGRTSDLATTATAMYELYTTDLRPELPRITVPVLNLHAWVAYKGFGMTRERAVDMFGSQYKGLPNGSTSIHDEAYHFIMYDAPDWMHGEMKGFLAKVKR